MLFGVFWINIVSSWCVFVVIRKLEISFELVLKWFDV